MAASLTLYVDSLFASPYAMAAYVALSEKQLPFEIRLIDLQAGEQRMQPYQNRAPTCRVPALTHDGFHLTESSAITEYLEDTFAPPAYAALYPADVPVRARARQIQAWLRSDLTALREARTTAVIFHDTPPAALNCEAQAAAAKLVRVAQTWLPGGQADLFGHWTLADTELALMLKRLASPGDNLPDALRRYAEAQWRRASVRQWIQHNRDARG